MFVNVAIKNYRLNHVIFYFFFILLFLLLILFFYVFIFSVYDLHPQDKALRLHYIFIALYFFNTLNSYL
jgi:hypothetical protein